MTEFVFSIDERGGRIKIAEKARGLLDRFRRREAVDFEKLKASDRAVAIALARLRGFRPTGNHQALSAPP